MRKLLAAVAAAAALTGCGYVSGPLAPLANIPEPVTGVAALQRGGTIYLHFTAPSRTTENVLIRESLTADVRIGVWPNGYTREQWAAGATRLAEREVKAGSVQSYEAAAAPWVGKDAVIGVRVAGANGKESEWTTPLILPVVTAPAKPSDVAVADIPGGVRVTWQGAGTHFRVLRKTGDEPYAVVAPDVSAHEWTDTSAAVGTAYSYVVQAIQPVGQGSTAESELSAAVGITPAAPPPAAVTGLRAVPAPASIELSWDTAGPDVTAYRIYRAEGDGAFQRIAESGAVPTYSDRAVQAGKTYRYEVAAVNGSGREGARSAPVTVSLP